MRIACVDNMNHMMFSLTRFLRDRGIHADLLLSDDTPPHFHPSADSFDDEYRAWTRQLSWGSARSFFRVTGRTVQRDLGAYDAVLGGGFLPAFCEKIGRRLDIFVPRGDDLFMYPFGVGRRGWLTRLPGAYLSRMQRRGIQRARRVFSPDFFRPYRDALVRLGVDYERIPVPPIYYPQYDRVDEPALHGRLAYADRFAALRERSGFVLFCHARQYWRTARGISDGTSKGNDLLVEGFARYVHESGRRDARLVLFEYGDDVAATKAWCAHLRVESWVAWLPRMARKELMYGALRADVGADQFTVGNSDGGYGGTAIELMSAGRPVLGRLAYTSDEFLARVGFPMPPIVNVHSAAEVAASLARLAEHPTEAAALGARGREWVEQYYGDKIVERYVAALSAR